MSFPHKTIAQAVVVVKAMHRGGAIKLPICVELANGSDAGWERAAIEYLVARAKGERYNPVELGQVDWKEEAGDDEERERLRSLGA